MIKQRSQVLCLWFLVCDLLLTAVSWIGAYYLRFETGWIPLTKDRADIGLCWNDLPLVLLLAAGCFHLTGQYSIDRLRRLRDEIVFVAKRTALLCLGVMASTFLLHDPYEPPLPMRLPFFLPAATLATAEPLPRA